MSILECPHDGEFASSGLGRRKGTKHGQLRANVLIVVQSEDEDNPPTDLAIAAGEGVHESAISEARRAIGIPASRVRARNYREGTYRVGHGLAYCAVCMVKYKVPTGKGSIQCPENHGTLVLSDYALALK